jgi:hypothetical protein
MNGAKVADIQSTFKGQTNANSLHLRRDLAERGAYVRYYSEDQGQLHEIIGRLHRYPE